MKKHLYDTIADRWLNSKGSVWIISDTHFSELDCYKLRFPNTFQPGTEYMHDSLVEKLDKMQIKNINSKCGKNDTLIILGDVGDIEWVRNLKARYKILVMGNHDKGASNYKKEKWQTAKLHYYTDNSKPFASFKLSDYSAFAIPKVMDELLDKAKKEHADYAEGYWTWKLYDEDNHLFDEVYEGPLMINDRVILSHEPIDVPKYMFNIHGHTHALPYKYDDRHLNMCAEAIDYTPINLLNLIKNGLLSKTDSIHRETIDKAVIRKENKKSNK